MIANDPELAEQERAEVAEQRQWVLLRESKQYQHEQTLKKIEVDGNVRIKQLEAELAKAQGASRERVLAIRAIILGIIKLPALPFAVLFCWVLEQSGHDTPEALENFITL